MYRWIDFGLDRRAFRRLNAAGRLGWGAWLASLAAPKVYSIFAWRDPLPFLRFAGQRLRGRRPATAASGPLGA